MTKYSQPSENNPFVRVTWTTPFVQSSWDELVKIGRILEKEADADHDALLIYILPTENEPRLGQINIVRHRQDGSGASIIKFHFTAGPPPEEAPPEEIKVQSAAIGGIAGFAELLARLFANMEMSSASVLYRCTFVLEHEKWKSLEIPRNSSNNPNIAALGNHSYMEQVGYRFIDGALGLKEVSLIYYHEVEMYKVQVIASSSLEIGEIAWFPYAQVISKMVLTQLFSPQEESHVPD